MSLEEQVRREVARFVWPSNPHSVSMAGAAIGFAKLIDQGVNRGDAGHMVLANLRMAVAHLKSCEATPDRLDELRADVCRKALGSYDGGDQ